MNNSKMNSFDRRWMWSLFGTAVGAGILFLPIRAGTGGFWPIVVMCCLIFPMTWLSHRALARFVNSSSKPGSDITKVVEEHFGFGWGFAVTVLYFFAIYPICLAYGVGITNVVDSFIVNQLGLDQVNRLVLAVVMVSAMMAVMLLSEEKVTKVCESLVYPLCFILLAFSLYLVPNWKFDAIASMPSAKDFVVVVWLTLPVLVFAFNHSPAVSTFALSIEKEYGENKNAKTNQIEFHTSAALLSFVMLFVFSCIMCLDNADFAAAREANIPILSYFANKFDNPVITYAGPAVAFLAILSSFFGHYYGAREGLNGIIRKASKKDGVQRLSNTTINAITTIFMYVTIIAVGYVNPSILGFIEDLGGPIIAAILFIMPIVAIYTVPSMAKFKNKFTDIFVFVMGSLTILSIIIKML
ncbi:Serine transporter [Campylobacter majalis]|uniref:Serine transporter n=1 Tax=Campylobacter majalis TaxID=2790656 RepID=A0ABN7KC84_9BACT|nr:aromatic amino acid transport family protein [Campylobacter majalis]CAD7289132.1 Serine transporter [Campylobacter majalis]